MDKLLDSFETVFGNGFLKYFKEQEKKHHYFNLNDYKKVIQKFVEDEQRERVNYYDGTHVHFTRFLLVSIEKFKNNGRAIDFTELDHKGKLIWQLEHVIPQSNFEKKDSDKNKLGNLTLLHRDTNVKISDEDFDGKKKELKNYCESEFFINKVFRRDKFLKSDIEQRTIDLQLELKDIFENYFDEYCEKVLSLESKSVGRVSISSDVINGKSRKQSNVTNESVIHIKNLMKNFNESIGANVPTISQSLKKVIQNNVQDIFKPFEKIASIQPNYSNILEVLSKQFSKLQTLYNFKNIGNFLKNIDFDDYRRQLDEQRKRKIAKCLHFDIYPPILFLDELASMEKITEQSEADYYLSEHLKYWEEQRGRSVYDFIPKSLRTYKEVVQLEYLESLKMYKMMVIFCLERIEFILSQIQIQEQGTHFSEILTSNKSFKNFVNTSNDDNFLKELVSQIAYLSEYHEKGFVEVNLFKKFKDIESDYIENSLPLNRNIFMHGLVDEKYVGYLLVQKSVLAYAFFEELYVLKTTDKKYLRLQLFKRKGISKKCKIRFYIKKCGRKSLVYG
ncbi:HNH endonuclease family protein [Streptococcus thermophilus]|uniref:HNH endonuclease family protein n=1 Tax=Streptococcus thermophilus TaxID=1308 RepID=UPI0022EB0390|nr:HNH endonuclease family protein [Streptococcus thermophilus]MDA3776161.1 HNH endonuclease family protein [Streptococcus thermophilus]